MPRRSSARSRMAAPLAALVALSLTPLLGGAPPAAAATRCPSQAPSAPHRPGKAPRIVGWLHSCPGTIRNAKGQRIRLEGLEFFGTAAGATGAGACNGLGPFFPPSYAGADIRKWGFNEVELFISWQNLEPSPPTIGLHGNLVHHYDRNYLTGLDQAIAQFQQAGLAVVLVEQQARWSAAFQNIDGGYNSYSCGQGMPAWIYEKNNQSAGAGPAMVKAEVDFFQNRTKVQAQTGLLSEPVQTSFTKMWKFLARRYKQNSAVVGMLPIWEPYDILTRSYAGASSYVTPRMLHLAGFYERIGGAIHASNPRVLVIFPEQLSRRTHQWALLKRPKVPNAVMGSEFYAKSWSTDGAARMKLYVQRAHGWRYPFAADEFDAFGETTNRPHPGWSTSLTGMLAYCRKQHVSWTLLGYKQVQVSGDPHQAKPELLPLLRKGF